MRNFVAILGNITFSGFSESEEQLFKFNHNKRRALIHGIDSIKLFDNTKDANIWCDENETESYLVLGTPVDMRDDEDTPEPTTQLDPNEFEGEVVYETVDVQIEFIEMLFNDTMLGLTEIEGVTKASPRLIEVVEKSL